MGCSILQSALRKAADKPDAKAETAEAEDSSATSQSAKEEAGNDKLCSSGETNGEPITASSSDLSSSQPIENTLYTLPTPRCLTGLQSRIEILNERRRQLLEQRSRLSAKLVHMIEKAQRLQRSREFLLDVNLSNSNHEGRQRSASLSELDGAGEHPLSTSQSTQRLFGSPSAQQLNLNASVSSDEISSAEEPLTNSSASDCETTTTPAQPPSVSAEPKQPESHEWGFVFANIGDCKAFIWRHASGEVSDITATNRCGSSNNASDPGGRIGPYLQGRPDLRNLVADFIPCNEDDIIIVVSDGVHDNLDPQSLGKSPTDCGLTGTSWEELDSELVEKTKTTCRENMIRQFIDEQIKMHNKVSPAAISRALLNHAVATTLASRHFLETYRTELPCDYVRFPGKMDHTTCIAYRVCDVRATLIALSAARNQQPVAPSSVETQR